MKKLGTIRMISYILIAVGAINWGLIGIFNWNLVSAVFGVGALTKTIYILVGLAGLVGAYDLIKMWCCKPMPRTITVVKAVKARPRKRKKTSRSSAKKTKKRSSKRSKKSKKKKRR